VVAAAPAATCCSTCVPLPAAHALPVICITHLRQQHTTTQHGTAHSAQRTAAKSSAQQQQKFAGASKATISTRSCVTRNDTYKSCVSVFFWLSMGGCTKLRHTPSQFPDTHTRTVLIPPSDQPHLLASVAFVAAGVECSRASAACHQSVDQQLL
jgi:hypothetical protein